MAEKPGRTMLTAGFHDPVLRAEWERQQCNARKNALREVDELEQFYRTIPDGNLDSKRDLRTALGRDLVLKTISIVREALRDGSGAWRNELNDLRRLHQRVVISLGPALKRGISGLAGARQGHEQTHGTAEEKHQRWTKYQQAVDDLMKRNPRISYTHATNLVASHFGVVPRTIRRNTKNPQPRK
jgi:hypothetical protein